MMTTSKSTNKRDYKDKGTYDNLREGDRNMLLSTSTSITCHCTCQDCSVGKVDVLVLEGEEEIIVYVHVNIDDGNSE
jgi:hypothetical protein